ncbi:MAG: hypothetical protein K6C12_10365 [Oscillospiraceae bacterium]|nr:hypothetical protein [Oscillospiraceae bacterium]
MEKRKLRKSILDSRIFWMIVSLLGSLAIWTYVISTENSDVTQIFRGVQVEIVGEDTLRSAKNLIVTDVDTSSVRVEINGPRRIVDALNSEDLIAQVDVSKLTRAAYASMKYKIIYPNNVDTRNVTEVRYSPETVNFTVSMMNTVTVPVRGAYEGSVAAGFTAEAPVFEPSTVTVSGPEAYLKDVAYAWVGFGTGVTAESSYQTDTPFILMDSEGNAVNTEYLTPALDTVSATLPIMEMKNIPLAVELIEGSGATTANTKVTITPDRITLAGDSAILAGMNRIVLSTISLSDFRSSFSETYTIPFDNSLRNLSGITEAKVDIEIVGLSTAVYTVKNLSMINIPDGMEADIVSESIDVEIRGTEEQLEALKAESIRAVADLTDYKGSTGTFMPTVKIYVDGFTDVGPVGSYTVPVEIREARVVEHLPEVHA